jgi:hypothetical protein
MRKVPSEAELAAAYEKVASASNTPPTLSAPRFRELFSMPISFLTPDGFCRRNDGFSGFLNYPTCPFTFGRIV